MGLPEYSFGGDKDMSTMSHELTPEGAAARISNALDAIRQDLLPLESILKPFEELFVARARLKAELPSFTDFPVTSPDPTRFEKGVPLTSEEVLAASPDDVYNTAAKQILAALERGFPRIRKDVLAIRMALSDGRLNPQRCHIAMAGGRNDELERIASDLSICAESLKFVLGQIVKPLVEKKAEGLVPLVKDLRWHRGYCPLCGSMPELSFLKGEEGQRWLRCSFCGHTWRFARLACPFCETENHNSLQTYYVVGREQERVEICEECRRYVVCLDLRGRFDEAVLEVAAIGLVHLDLLAQEKGHLPAALCAWNIVRSQDITSSEVALETHGEETQQVC
jgi:FdhE protein